MAKSQQEFGWSIESKLANSQRLYDNAINHTINSEDRNLILGEGKNRFDFETLKKIAESLEGEGVKYRKPDPTKEGVLQDEIEIDGDPSKATMTIVLGKDPDEDRDMSMTNRGMDEDRDDDYDPIIADVYYSNREVDTNFLTPIDRKKSSEEEIRLILTGDYAKILYHQPFDNETTNESAAKLFVEFKANELGYKIEWPKDPVNERYSEENMRFRAETAAAINDVAWEIERNFGNGEKARDIYNSNRELAFYEERGLFTDRINPIEIKAEISQQPASRESYTELEASIDEGLSHNRVEIHVKLKADGYPTNADILSFFDTNKKKEIRFSQLSKTKQIDTIKSLMEKYAIKNDVLKPYSTLPLRFHEVSYDTESKKFTMAINNRSLKHPPLEINQAKTLDEVNEQVAANLKIKDPLEKNDPTKDARIYMEGEYKRINGDNRLVLKTILNHEADTKIFKANLPNEDINSSDTIYLNVKDAPLEAQKKHINWAANDYANHFMKHAFGLSGRSSRLVTPVKDDPEKPFIINMKYDDKTKKWTGVVENVRFIDNVYAKPIEKKAPEIKQALSEEKPSIAASKEVSESVDKADKIVELDADKKALAKDLIDMIKNSEAPWQQGWKQEGIQELPFNASTGKAYSGNNTMKLIMDAHKKGYEDPRYLTFNQAKALGGSVKKGEKGIKITAGGWQDIESKDGKKEAKLDQNGQTPETEKRFIAKTAVVFNASQIAGLPDYNRKPIEWQPNEIAEKLLKESGAAIEHREVGMAYYSPQKDTIVLPQKGSFNSDQDYYSTALHELGHWTGHESRLNRDLKHPFGSDGYAKEELVAEISSMMLAKEYGIKHNPDNHAAYLKSWVKAVEADPNIIFKSITAADKVVKHIHNLAPEIKQAIEEARKIEPPKAEQAAEQTKSAALAIETEDRGVKRQSSGIEM